MIVKDNLDSPPNPFCGYKAKSPTKSKVLKINLTKFAQVGYVDSSELFNVYVGGAYIWETPYMNDVLKRGV